jgi:hypothetical protein
MSLKSGWVSLRVIQDLLRLRPATLVTSKEDVKSSDVVTLSHTVNFGWITELFASIDNNNFQLFQHYPSFQSLLSVHFIESYYYSLYGHLPIVERNLLRNKVSSIPGLLDTVESLVTLLISSPFRKAILLVDECISFLSAVVIDDAKANV